MFAQPTEIRNREIANGFRNHFLDKKFLDKKFGVATQEIYDHNVYTYFDLYCDILQKLVFGIRGRSVAVIVVSGYGVAKLIVLHVTLKTILLGTVVQGSTG